jgi:two-component system chemotaxis response regulator CheY
MAYNILIVDDSLTSRTFIRRALEMAGLPLSQIHQATNGLEALDLLQREWVDLVLTDINMPDMNGDELVRRMRATDLLKSIPVVIVSTDCSERRMAEMTAAGVQAYLTKPVTPEDLKATVERLLGKGLS